jgi:hypothetical protein
MSTTLKLTTRKLNKLRREHNAFMAKMKHKTTTWVCPACGFKNKTIYPTKEEVDSRGFWDSLKTCVGEQCGCFSMVTVYPDKSTAAYDPDSEKVCNWPLSSKAAGLET